MKLSDKDIGAMATTRKFRIRYPWMNRLTGVFAVIFLALLFGWGYIGDESPYALPLFLIALGSLLIATASGIYVTVHRQRAARAFVDHYKATGVILPEGPDGMTEIPQPDSF